jgi:hypothetical protein
MEEIQIPEFIAHRKIKDEIIILNLKTRKFYLVEGGGKEILDLIDKGINNIYDIIENLIKKYGEMWREKIEEDSREFIKKCVELEILTLKRIKGGEL